MPLNPTFAALSALNNTNSPSPSGVQDGRTGLPIYIGGQVLGEYADLTETEANQLSSSLGATLHAGRYRLVQVDSGATAANVRLGTVGMMATLAQGFNVVTSADKALALGLRPVVFLNAIAPGNYGFVQELGDASVLAGAALSKAAPAIGDVINATTTGVVDDPTSQNYVAVTIGVATTLPAINSLVRVLLEAPVVQG